MMRVLPPSPLRYLAALLLIIGLSAAAPAQPQNVVPQDAPTEAGTTAAPWERAQISLITVLPGDAVYSMFGHSAIRVFDPDQDIDATFNYGTFDFDVAFLPRFIYGKLDYFLSVYSFQAAARHYEFNERRPVIEQVLNLSPSQKEQIYAFLLVNARPENRYYRYDFLFDNCSTRIRDVLSETLGDDLQFAPEPDPGLSFRRLLDPYMRDRPFLDFGIDLALGTPTDRVAEPAQTMFLPIFLMEAFDHAMIEVEGESLPLVARTDTLVRIEGYAMSPPRLPWAVILLWILLAAAIGITYRDYRNGRVGARIGDIVLSGIAGLAGLLIVFLWFISLHDVTRYNWHLLWAWPTHLVAAGLLIRSRTAIGTSTRRYLMAAALAAAVFAAGWPLWPQYMHPAALPLVLLVAVRAGWLAFSPSPRRTFSRRSARPALQKEV